MELEITNATSNVETVITGIAYAAMSIVIVFMIWRNIGNAGNKV